MVHRIWVQNGPNALWAASHASATPETDSQPKACHGSRLRKSRDRLSQTVTTTITIAIGGVHQHAAAASPPERNHANLPAGLNAGRIKDHRIKAALSSRWQTE